MAGSNAAVLGQDVLVVVPIHSTIDEFKELRSIQFAEKWTHTLDS